MDVQFFKFEADFVDSLRCVPMIVRFKLDACGIKLTLRAWAHFSLSTRARLVTMPADTLDDVTRYREFLARAIEQTGEPWVAVPASPAAVWGTLNDIPEAVVRKARELGVPFHRLRGWMGLNPLQRFALVKLTRSGHDNNNFLPALREFGLVD